MCQGARVESLAHSWPTHSVWSVALGVSIVDLALLITFLSFRAVAKDFKSWKCLAFPSGHLSPKETANQFMSQI